MFFSRALGRPDVRKALLTLAELVAAAALVMADAVYFRYRLAPRPNQDPERKPNHRLHWHRVAQSASPGESARLAVDSKWEASLREELLPALWGGLDSPVARQSEAVPLWDELALLGSARFLVDNRSAASRWVVVLPVRLDGRDSLEATRSEEGRRWDVQDGLPVATR